MLLPIMPALNIFSIPLQAYTVKAGYDINKRWLEKVDCPDFTFSGSFQPAGDKELQNLAAGDRSKGASILHTRQRFEITDTSQDTGQEKKQTFIRKGDEIWRIVAVQDWSEAGGFYRYLCVRYLNSRGHEI